jgi:hypothetical protein
MNQIVTITMVGQWHHGLPLHLGNMKWALGQFVHESYVVTTNEIKRTYEKLFPKVHFIGVPNKGGFIKFWDMFPSIVKEHKIDADFFLLMEQDIFFHNKLVSLPHDEREIVNYLPLSKYHSMTVNGEIYHHRVWEGANMFYGKLIHAALQDNISFSFTRNYFFENKRQEWESKLGGPIGMHDFKIPDTMDELCYYYPMKHNTEAVHEDKAIHIRGPETIHRHFPKLYHDMTPADMDSVKKKLPYLDIYVTLAAFFISGNYESIDKYDMKKMKPENKGMFKRLRYLGREWMDPAASAKLEYLCDLIG